MATVDLSTEDNLQYTFYPVSSGYVNFKVRASNDAHVALTTGPAESDPMVEIFIGGWGNTKSVIRLNRSKPDQVEEETPDILNADEFRGFWIRWTGGQISAGKEGDGNPFISWENPNPFVIQHVGVCTGWGATGTWKIEVGPSAGAPTAAPLRQFDASCWVPVSGGGIPADAVVGGQDGENLYVGRAQHEGALIPGKVVPSHGACYVAWGGAEHAKNEYEVLAGCSTRWVSTSGAAIPDNALPGGESEEGEPLFIGRAYHNDTVTIGKVQPSHGTCYIPYGGEELSFGDYEVLVPQ